MQGIHRGLTAPAPFALVQVKPQAISECSAKPERPFEHAGWATDDEKSVRRTRRTLLPDVSVPVPVVVAAIQKSAGINPSPEPRTDSRRLSAACSSTVQKVNCKHDPVRLPLTEQTGRQSVIQLVRLPVLRCVPSLCLGEGCSSFYYAVAAAAHAACERYLPCSIVLQLLLFTARSAPTVPCHLSHCGRLWAMAAPSNMQKPKMFIISDARKDFRPRRTLLAVP